MDTLKTGTDTFFLLLGAAMLGIETGGSLVLYAIRAPALKGGGLFSPVSREGGLLFNNIFLSVGAGTVLLGTLYPLFMDALNLGKVSVGAPYYNIIMTPLMTPMIVLMAVGPFLAWKRGDLAGAMQKLRFTTIVTAIVLVATLIAAGISSHTLLAALGLALAAWLLVGSLAEWAGRVRLFQGTMADRLRRMKHLPRSAYGMTVGHIGLAFVLIGVVASLAWRSEFLQVMQPGDSANIAGYQVKFLGTEDNVVGPNYSATRANFVVIRDGQLVTDLHPERRMYNNPRQPLSTVAIHTNFFADLYAVLGDPAEHGGSVVHIFHNPMVAWIFFGAIVMVLGGVISLTDRHHRIGAPLRRVTPYVPSSPAPASPAPAASAPAVTKRGIYLIPLAGFLILGGFFIWRLHLVEKGYAPNLIPSVLINKPAPSFDLAALEQGKPGFASTDLKGQVTLVNFFASWCVPCREEHPVLPLVKQAGIRLVGISYKDRPEDARAWLANLGDPYMAIGADVYGRTGIDFGVYGVPETFLIDKQGRIRYKFTGPLNADSLEHVLLPHIKELQGA